VKILANQKSIPVCGILRISIFETVSKLPSAVNKHSQQNSFCPMEIINQEIKGTSTVGKFLLTVVPSSQLCLASGVL
jgi:hypothetical protein